jgi:Flp pilus assembly protein TadD
VQGDEPKARELYRSALLRTPGDVEAAVNLAGSYEQSGELDPAIDVLQRALAVVPDSIDVLRAAGRVLVARNRATEAVTLLARAKQIAGSDAGIRADYGRALIAAGRTPEGMAEVQAARALDPTVPLSP